MCLTSSRELNCLLAWTWSRAITSSELTLKKGLQLLSCTPFGHYQWKVLSFGLTNAPAVFARTLSGILGDLVGKCCLVYLDDIAIISATWTEHLQHIHMVLDKLRQAHVYVNLSK